MTLAVSRRTTEASRASEVFTDPVRPEVDLELDLPTPPHALELDVFSRRYGDRVDGRVGAAPVFEYLRPLDRCAASLLSSPASTSMAAGQLASVLSQTGEDCSTPWMVPESQYGKKNAKKLKRKTPQHLFQYKPYETQEALRLSEDEMAGVVSAVFSSASSELYEARDAGVVILIKVVMDVFLEKGGDAAFGQVASLLRKPLVRQDAPVEARRAVFDVIVNLMIHGELLCVDGGDGGDGGGGGGGGDGADGDDGDDGSWMSTVRRQTSNVTWLGVDDVAGVDGVDGARCVRQREAFRGWLRRILFDLLEALAASCDESVSSASTEIWSAALSCVMALCTRDGFVVRAWVDAFPLPALKRMLLVARTGFWATRVQSLLACLACNVMYDDKENESQDDEKGAEKGDGAELASLNRSKLAGFGGVSGVVKEYQYAPTELACRSLFCVLLDSVGASVGVSRAMLRSGACEFLRDYLVMPSLPSDEDVDENLARVIHSVCTASMSPSKSGSERAAVEFDDVLECIRSLKRAASEPGDLPDDDAGMMASFEATLEAGVFGQTDTRHWDMLRSLLVSDSPKERVIGRSWMVKLMMSVLDAGVTDPKERNAIIPPPVPLLPSSVPDQTLFTFGDTILSALTQEKARKTPESRQEERGRFVGDDDVVTNFALAVRQVVGGIRFRTLNIGGTLHAKWTSSGVVDADRLCMSTIERAFEWISGFSSAPEWSSAIALVVESMVVVATSCSKSANVEMALGGIGGVRGIAGQNQPPSTPTGDSVNDATASASESASASDQAGLSRHHTPEGPSLAAPLHIPSPSSAGRPDSTGPLSPLSKIVPGLWRRLKTPGSKNPNNRPHSSESQSSNPDNGSSGSGAERPLSAGLMAMDAVDHQRERLNRPTANLSLSIQTSKNFNDVPTASRMGSVTAHAHNTQWVSLADKVARVKERRSKETSNALASVHATVLAYNRTIDPIEAFVTSTSLCPPAILDMLSPTTLKEIFDAMNHVVVKANGVSGKPFWDARLATFILLIASCTKKNSHNHPLLKDGGYVQSMVRDPDLRVRHHACAFILSRFSEKDNEAFIRATRAIVSMAQGGNDEGLLRDPELRVRKMMDLGMITTTAV